MINFPVIIQKKKKKFIHRSTLRLRVLHTSGKDSDRIPFFYIPQRYGIEAYIRNKNYRKH